MGDEETSGDRMLPSELLVKSKVRTLAREADVRVSDEVWDALGHVITRRVKRAIGRAKANGRKTVKACDL